MPSRSTKHNTLSRDLRQSLKEVLAHRQGKLALRVIDMPAPPTKYDPTDIKKLRKAVHYSQSYLALVLGVRVRDVQAWEEGKRVPTQPILRLLELVEKGIYRPSILP